MIDQKLLEQAHRVLAKAPIWDNHACMPLRAGDGDFLPQLQRARANGVSTISLNIGCAEQDAAAHVKVLAWFRRWLGEHSADYRLIRSPEDVVLARTEGRLGVFFDIEGARGIDDQISLISMYYELGVRWMLIAYNAENLAGYGCYDKHDAGLKPFGRDMVAEMNRVGMTVCCSHTGERTARDAMMASTRPVIFSHSNCAALHSHNRNISDQMIRDCAQQGGVIGINGIGDFLCPPDANLIEAYVQHVDHVAQLVGPAHVGLSLDYCYDRQELIDYLTTMKASFPEGFSTEIRMVAPDDLPEIVARLIGLGYEGEALNMILGENWMRVAKANWQ